MNEQAIVAAPRTSSAIVAKDDLDTIMNLGRVLSASGYFGDVVDEAQAAAKMLYGRELGLEPVAALQGIWFIQFKVKDKETDQYKWSGRLEISAQARAAMIRRSGRYWFKVKDHTDSKCAIEFFEKSPVTNEWDSCGVIEYTVDTAKKAGASFDDRSNWKKHPADMLFAAAMRRGARRYCGDLFLGEPPHARDEDDVQVVDAVVTQELEADSAPARALPTGGDADAAPDVERRKRRIHVLCKELGWDEATRHAEAGRLFDGRESLNELTPDELNAFIAHLLAEKDAAENEFANLEAESPLVASDDAPTAQGTPSEATTEASAPGDATVIAGIRCAPVTDGGPPADPDTDEGRSVAQMNKLHRLIERIQVDAGDVQKMFEARYGHALLQATKLQCQAFTDWLEDQAATRDAAGATR